MSSVVLVISNHSQSRSSPADWGRISEMARSPVTGGRGPVSGPEGSSVPQGRHHDHVVPAQVVVSELPGLDQRGRHTELPVELVPQVAVV